MGHPLATGVSSREREQAIRQRLADDFVLSLNDAEYLFALLDQLRESYTDIDAIKAVLRDLYDELDALNGQILYEGPVQRVLEWAEIEHGRHARPTHTP